MKKLTQLFLFVVLGIALLAATGLADTTDTAIFRTVLSPANEVPPIAGLDAGGTAVVLVHFVRDNQGNVIGGSVDFIVNYSFPGTITITGLHIHPGAAGVNGPVTIPAVTTQIVDAARVGTIQRQAVITSSNTAAFNSLVGILSRPDQFYVNLHTTVNPGGAMRGQLFPADFLVLRGVMSPANEVPPIVGLDASGSASVAVLATRDGSSGAIVSASVIFAVQYRFPTTVNLTGLHIHPGPAGVNGPVTISSGLPSTADAPATGTLTLLTEVLPTNTAGLATLDTLFRTPDQAYINLHTSVNPGGAIRAQLQRTDSVFLRAEMSPANEVPPIPGLAASAAAGVFLFVTRDSAGEITSGTVTFDVSFRGFPAGTEFVGLHIHQGGAGVNGPVIISSGLSRLTTADGNGNIFLAVDVPGTDTAGVNALKGLLANPDNWYVNLHTTVNPGGAVRAQAVMPGEPGFSAFLDPGNYVVEVTLPSGQPAGVWAMRTLVGSQVLPGGFNLGSAFGAGGTGFGGFVLDVAKTVNLTLAAQALPGQQGPQVVMRLWDSQGRQVGEEVRGATSASTSRSLQPGFYAVEVTSLAGAGVFQLSMGADGLAFGAIAGGYLAPGITGFGGFNVPVREAVIIQLFGKGFYRGSGAGNLTLTLRDSRGAVLARSQ